MLLVAKNAWLWPRSANPSESDSGELPGTRGERNDSPGSMLRVMAWLMVEDRVVASVEVVTTRHARRKGLLGRQGIEGAMLLSPTKSVHTVGMKFAIDVAHLDSDMCVLAVTTMKPGRVGRFSWRTRHVLEAEAGSLQRFGINPGVQIEVRS